MMAMISVQALLIGFLVILLVLAVIAGLIWFLEKYIHPIPDIVKVILVIALVILVVLWAFGIITGQPPGLH